MSSVTKLVPAEVLVDRAAVGGEVRLARIRRPQVRFPIDDALVDAALLRFGGEEVVLVLARERRGIAAGRRAVFAFRVRQLDGRVVHDAASRSELGVIARAI